MFSSRFIPIEFAADIASGKTISEKEIITSLPMLKPYFITDFNSWVPATVLSLMILLKPSSGRYGGLQITKSYLIRSEMSDVIQEVFKPSVKIR